MALKEWQVTQIMQISDEIDEEIPSFQTTQDVLAKLNRLCNALLDGHDPDA